MAIIPGRDRVATSSLHLAVVANICPLRQDDSSSSLVKRAKCNFEYIYLLMIGHEAQLPRCPLAAVVSCLKRIQGVLSSRLEVPKVSLTNTLSKILLEASQARTRAVRNCECPTPCDQRKWHFLHSFQRPQRQGMAVLFGLCHVGSQASPVCRRRQLRIK